MVVVVHMVQQVSHGGRPQALLCKLGVPAKDKTTEEEGGSCKVPECTVIQGYLELLDIAPPPQQ